MSVLLRGPALLESLVALTLSCGAGKTSVRSVTTRVHVARRGGGSHHAHGTSTHRLPAMRLGCDHVCCADVRLRCAWTEAPTPPCQAIDAGHHKGALLWPAKRCSPRGGACDTDDVMSRCFVLTLVLPTLMPIQVHREDVIHCLVGLLEDEDTGVADAASDCLVSVAGSCAAATLSTIVSSLSSTIDGFVVLCGSRRHCTRCSLWCCNRGVSSTAEVRCLALVSRLSGVSTAAFDACRDHGLLAQVRVRARVVLLPCGLDQLTSSWVAVLAV